MLFMLRYVVRAHNYNSTRDKYWVICFWLIFNGLSEILQHNELQSINILSCTIQNYKLHYRREWSQGSLNGSCISAGGNCTLMDCSIPNALSSPSDPDNL